MVTDATTAVAWAGDAASDPTATADTGMALSAEPVAVGVPTRLPPTMDMPAGKAPDTTVHVSAPTGSVAAMAVSRAKVSARFAKAFAVPTVSVGIRVGTLPPYPGMAVAIEFRMYMEPGAYPETMRSEDDTVPVVPGT